MFSFEELLIVSLFPIFLTVASYCHSLVAIRTALRTSKPNNFFEDVPLLSSSGLVHRAIVRIHIISLAAFLVVLYLTASIDLLRAAFPTPACPELTQFQTHSTYIGISLFAAMAVFVLLQRHLQEMINQNLAPRLEKVVDIIFQSCIFTTLSIYSAMIMESICSRVAGLGINQLALEKLVGYGDLWGAAPCLMSVATILIYQKIASRRK